MDDGSQDPEDGVLFFFDEIHFVKGFLNPVKQKVVVDADHVCAVALGQVGIIF